jgi:aconitate hydratase 2/2-methylisocitrate dehydratase
VLEAYRKHVAERAAENLPPLPLDARQVADLVENIKNPPAGEEEFLLDLLVNRVPPGVDQAAYVIVRLSCSAPCSVVITFSPWSSCSMMM